MYNNPYIGKITIELKQPLFDALVCCMYITVCMYAYIEYIHEYIKRGSV